MSDDIDPHQHAVPTLPHLTIKPTNVNLPSIPWDLRRYGREGILLVEIIGVPGVKHAVVIPADVSIIGWCGTITASFLTFRNHCRSHKDCSMEYLDHPSIGRQDHIGRGSTQSYKVVPIQQQFVDWSNKQLSTLWDDSVVPSEYNHQPSQTSYHPASFYDFNPSQRPLINAPERDSKTTGVQLFPIPNTMRRLGPTGVFVMKIVGTKGPRWVVVLPPRMHILTWCGHLSNNFRRLGSDHGQCELCLPLPGSHVTIPTCTANCVWTLRDTTVYGFSKQRADWCNKVIQEEAASRAVGLENGSLMLGVKIPSIDESYQDRLDTKASVMEELLSFFEQRQKAKHHRMTFLALLQIELKVKCSSLRGEQTSVTSVNKKRKYKDISVWTDA